MYLLRVQTIYFSNLFWRERLLSDQGCGTVRQKSCGAKPTLVFLPLPVFPLFGSRTIFRAGKTPKIAFLSFPLLPNPTETLATQAIYPADKSLSSG